MKKRLSKILWYGEELPNPATSSDDLEGLHKGELFLHLKDDGVTLWSLSADGRVVEISGGGGGDLSQYLLKSIWDRVWEIKTDSQGNEYIFGKLPVVTQYGITMYADGGELNLPSIYAGIPFDNKTIWLNPETKKVEVIGGTGGGVADSVHWNNIEGKPLFSAVATSGKYADLSGLPDLNVYATTEYLTAELKKYVTLNTEQTIGAHKDFLNGLSIGGLPITKSQDDVIYLDANLVVRGGITMYAEGEVNIPSIIDSLPIASTTAKGIASFDGTYFAVDSNGKVTLLAANVGLNEEELAAYLTEKKYATQSWVYSLGYASSSDLNALQTKVNDFLEGSDTDTIINKWKELESFLSGLSESDNLATILGTKANQSDLDDTNEIVATKWTQDDTKINNWDNAYKWGNHADVGYALKSYVDNEFKKYVTLADDQTISGVKTFTNGLKIGTSTINQSQNDVVYIDANLVVRGGITMYSDNTVDVGTIFDALPIDGNTIYWENGVLKANITEGVITNITSDMVVGALGFTPYNASNPKGYISGITSAMVVSALGYTPLQNHQTIYALTIKKNGTNVGTYTPNSAKKTINIVVPTKVSELDNDNEYATTGDLDSRINNLINGAPAAFDTLKEIADVLQGNVNSIGDIITTLGTKADKAIKISAGTGLSGGGTLEADRTLSLATSGVTAGTYKSVTVDKYGRVTSGTNPTTLAGYGITDAYTKTKVDELLGNYVTLATKQPITGEKNFTGGLKVNGSPIVYDATNKYWKLEGDLLVTGGVTMYASDSAFTPSTIMDAIATDEVNLKVVDGVLTFVGSSGGGLTEVYWDDVIGRPTLLSSFIDDVVQGNYLPLSGGNVTGQIGYNLDRDIDEIGIPAAGTFEYSSVIDFTTKKSFIGTVYSTTWDEYYNIISVRHRNGYGDGDGNGMYILSHITSFNESLSWNKQRYGTWQGERVILDSVNWRNYVNVNVSGTIENAYGLHNIDTRNENFSPDSYMGRVTWHLKYMNAIGFPYGSYGFGGLLNLSPWGDASVKSQLQIAYADDSNHLCFRFGNASTNIWGQWHEFLSTRGDIVHSQVCVNAIRSVEELVFSQSEYFDNHGNMHIPNADGSWSWNIFNSNGSNVMTVYTNGNVLSAGGITMYSDQRKKTILRDVELSLKQIADAPLIEHYYNSDAMRTTHVGSIAQYWAGINDWFCKLDSEGFYTMEIQNAALASAISIARELVKYESKTDRKIRLLKERVKELEDKIEKLENN